MAVNVSKTKFIIFHTKGKITDHSIHLTYDDNKPNENDPSLIHNIERFYTNHLNPQCRAYKILGIYIDEHLSFDFHTIHIISKLNRSLYCMNKVKKNLPPAAMKSLYYALIHSHLSYCPIITSCATNTNIQKILRHRRKQYELYQINKSATILALYSPFIRYSHIPNLFPMPNSFSLIQWCSNMNSTHSRMY